MVLYPTALPAAQNAPDWQEQVRARVAAQDLAGALALAEQRLSAEPGDLEARGWRGRLLAWTGRWAEAEAEYRRVLEAVPGDVDILCGLADVLAWQRRFAESLAALEHARALAPADTEVLMRRGRVLRALGREEEARGAFLEVLELDPGHAEARRALLASALSHIVPVSALAPAPAPAHEFRLGHEMDLFNFASDAHAVTAGLRSHWGGGWSTLAAGNFQRRFGEDAGRFQGSVTYRPTRRDAFTAGGGAGRHQGVVPRGDFYLEYARGVSTDRSPVVKGMELGLRQHWLWFREARVVALTPSALLYLPGEVTWAVQVTAARSRFPGTAAEWSPAGMTRLGFPVHARVRGEVFFAVGTENFAQADQVGRFAARTWGASARVRLSARQEFTVYALYQDRSQNRTQTSFGWSYAIRF